MAESTAAFRIGARLNQYELLRVLGQGGHAVVFHGHDKASHRDVAIKVIQNPKHDLKLRARAEADLLISLRHPHVVEVYDAGVAEDGSVYIVMEKLEGRSLREIIVRLRKLTVLEALPIAIQIASGVLAAHARKVVHRDLKPDNVFVRPDGTVKVLDFGIAKYLERSFDTTQKRMWQGTPSYMAPEQFQGLPVSYRSDVFALGVILYELIGGIKPSHVGGDPTSVEQFAIRQLAVDPPMLHKLDESVPTSVSRMIRRAIAKVPDDRFEMEEFLKKMQAELQNARKRSGGALPRDLVRACLDVTDPDCMPSFTAPSRQETRPVAATATNDMTLPGMGPDGNSAPPFAESQQCLITERLEDDVAPKPTRTMPPVVDDGEQRLDSQPVFSSRIFAAPRARSALSGALLLSAGVASLGIVGAVLFGFDGGERVEPAPHATAPKATTPKSNAQPLSLQAPGLSPAAAPTAVRPPVAATPQAVASTQAAKPESKPAAAAAADKAPQRKSSNAAPAVQEHSTSARDPGLQVSPGVAPLNVGSGLAEEPGNASSRRAASLATTKNARTQKTGNASAAGNTSAAGNASAEKRAVKLWFPPK